VKTKRKIKMKTKTKTKNKDDVKKKVMNINGVRREGVGRFTSLPLWTGSGGKEGCLPLILPLASAVGFYLSRYRRWDTRFRRVFCACEACCIVEVEEEEKKHHSSHIRLIRRLYTRQCGTSVSDNG
jgi:hypothetical protein